MCSIVNLDHFVRKSAELVAAGLDHIQGRLGKGVPLRVRCKLQAQAERVRLSKLLKRKQFGDLMRVVRTPWYSSLRSKGFLSNQERTCLTDSSTSATEAITGATTTCNNNDIRGQSFTLKHTNIKYTNTQIHKFSTPTCFSPAFTGFMHISLKRLRALQERRRQMY